MSRLLDEGSKPKYRKFAINQAFCSKTEPDTETGRELLSTYWNRPAVHSLKQTFIRQVLWNESARFVFSFRVHAPTHKYEYYPRLTSCCELKTKLFALIPTRHFTFLFIWGFIKDATRNKTRSKCYLHMSDWGGCSFDDDVSNVAFVCCFFLLLFKYRSSIQIES